MTKLQAIAAGLGVFLMTSGLTGANLAGDEKPPRFDYPKAPKAEVVNDYGGQKVADPFRPLEDPDSPETRAWIEAENRLTFSHLKTIPRRDRIKERLTELWDYEKFGVPAKRGERYFFTRNSGLQNQAVLFVADALNAEPRVLLDPNALSTDGTVALSGTEVSDDGKLLAYGLATAGSDWQEWRVRDVATAKNLDDRLQWVKFSATSWSKDGKGFFYGRYPEPEPGESLKGANYFQKLYYHRVGDPQSKDRLIYERPDHKEWAFHGETTDDGKYLIITVTKGTDAKYIVLYQDLTDPSAKPIELVGAFDAEYSFIDNVGPLFYFKTNKDAPRGRAAAIDIRNPKPEAWKEIIPQADETLESVDLVADRFLAVSLKDAHTQVKIRDLDGKILGEVKFPGLGTASGFEGKREDSETFYSFSSFAAPATIRRLDLSNNRDEVFRAPKLAYDPADYETKQVFYKSKDGTRVPMFISSKKGLKLDGKNPTYLYGYGGFNISLTPSFSPANLAWMEMGGVFAVPNLRGGGEYGEDWHQAGTKLKKQNVFDDFIAAAEWLIENQYTSTPKLAIGGGSNGGLLVGACLTQRPDLFGATLPAVGVMDMLRFHKFTIGWAWIDDYGSADDHEQFKALRAYSPLHNIKPDVAYPATLITTADHDDRVVPAHSFKFAATLQAAQAGSAPVLIRIETKAGHGAGKPTSKQIDEAADKWAFLVEALKMK